MTARISNHLTARNISCRKLFLAAVPPSPSYSSADIGKVLTVGEGSETVQTVIVPEQTVTLSDALGAALTIAEGKSLPSVGESVAVTLNGEMIQTTVTEYGGNPVVRLSETTNFGILFDSDTDAYLVSTSTSDYGTYTVSLTASVPSVEPKWKNVFPPLPTADGNYILTISNGTASWTNQSS